MPASERLTVSACRAGSSMGRLRCRMPIPPCRAMAMAMRASVTVSMAALTSGIRRVTLRVSRVLVSTSLGTTSDSDGCSSTSSNVSPSVANLAGTPSGVDMCAFRLRRLDTDIPWYLDWLWSRPGTGRGRRPGTVPVREGRSDAPGSVRRRPERPRPGARRPRRAGGGAGARAERAELLADLRDLGVYQALLEQRAVRGVV